MLICQIGRPAGKHPGHRLAALRDLAPRWPICPADEVINTPAHEIGHRHLKLCGGTSGGTYCLAGFFTYPFNPVITIPRTKYLCPRMNTSSTGMMTITDADMSSVQSVL